MRIITQQWGDSLTRHNLLGMGGILMLDIRHTKIENLPEVQIGDGYLWNLCVEDKHRRHHAATALLKKAERIATANGCERLWLEWNIKESPEWVFRWYCHLGYDEKVFGKGYALMCKQLKGGDDA